MPIRKPRPPEPVGNYGVRPQPKKTTPLDDLPPSYPASLTAQTHLIICKAVKQFPIQTKVAELCKYVITALRPRFRRAISENLLSQDMALHAMRELLRSLLLSNCDSDLSRYEELKSELMRSEEWRRLAKTVARSQPDCLERETVLPGTTSGQNSGASRNQRRIVDTKKELIARLKARNPTTRARKICELIDQHVNREPPALQANFAPLEQWAKQVPAERSWVGFYDDAKTRHLVRCYVNKVPPLNTARKSSK
jgi:hypothetical protein